MTANPTPVGTPPPRTDTCPGGDMLPAAGAFSATTNFHPVSRAAQLHEAVAILEEVGSHTDATLRRACRLITDLSPEHALRCRARDLMIFLED